MKNLQGDITGILDNSGTLVVTYHYTTWGTKITPGGTLATTVGEKNPYRYRGYRYDTESKLYYLNSRYYNPEWGRFVNADCQTNADQGIFGVNPFLYCLNNPVNMADDGGARASYWSIKSDWVGRYLLWRYLFGNGQRFVAVDGAYGDYMKANKTLRAKVQNILIPIGEKLKCNQGMKVNIRTSMEIQNGEDIIGYQYLHGTDRTAGGFQILGTIYKDKNGVVNYDLTYGWNDIINPNPIYPTDIAKAEFATKIPFAKPKDYYLSIWWTDKSRLYHYYDFRTHRMQIDWVHSTGWLGHLS